MKGHMWAPGALVCYYYRPSPFPCQMQQPNQGWFGQFQQFGFFVVYLGCRGFVCQYYSQWLNSAGTAFRNLCLAFHHLNLSLHHLAMPFRHQNKVFVICDKLRFNFPVYFRENHYNCCHQRSDLRLKCTKFYFGRGSAQTPLGELTALPHIPSWI